MRLVLPVMGMMLSGCSGVPTCEDVDAVVDVTLMLCEVEGSLAIPGDGQEVHLQVTVTRTDTGNTPAVETVIDFVPVGADAWSLPLTDADGDKCATASAPPADCPFVGYYPHEISFALIVDGYSYVGNGHSSLTVERTTDLGAISTVELWTGYVVSARLIRSAVD